jgi:iron complex outermembrane receptor protein
MRVQLLVLAATAASVVPSIAAAEAAAPTAGSEAVGLEEIVVTAQKRDERLQEVPLTVSALTGAQLERAGVTSSRDLTLLAPGLVMSQQILVAQPALRGVSGRGIGPGDEGTVPIYIDGVYQPVSHANSFKLSSVQRIEVLKGPQGTLFGRNAVGGAINIITRDPGTTFEGHVAASYARFNERQGELYLAGPLTETVGASLSMYASADDGYIDDLLRNRKSNPASNESIRGKVRWNIDADTELKLTANYTHVIDASGVAVHPLKGVTSGVNFNPRIIAGKYETASNQRQTSTYHTEGTSLQFERNFEAFTLTSLASFQYTESTTTLDTDQSPRPSSFSIIGTRDQTYTGEVRAVSNTDGPFHWIGGVFYYNSKSCYCDLNTNGTIIRATQGADAYALFGEITFDFTDRFSLTGGLRYSDEKRTIETFRNGLLIGRAEASFDNISPRVSAIYKFSETARVYFTFSEGFKSGVYNPAQTALPLRAVRPEVLTAYEIGVKTEPSRRAHINVSAFYYDYQDLQVSSRDTATNLTFLQNAAAAEIYGGEIQIDLAPTRAWNVSAGLAYTHAEFTEFPGANVLVNLPDKSGNSSTFLDVSGFAVPKSPELTVSLRTDYTIPLSSGSVTLAANAYYSSEFFWDFNNRLRTGAFTTLNLQASWNAPGDKLKLTAFLENVTNNSRPLTRTSGALSDNGSEVRPRAFGVRAAYDF